MGIRINTNTWRAPLLLIDSWLPITQKPRHTLHGAVPRVVQRFSRAGWLARSTEPNPKPEAASVTTHRQAGSHRRNETRTVRVLQAVGTNQASSQDTRLFISGRINDVCAELDRLVALEHQRAKAIT